MTPRDFALIALEAYSATPDIGIASSSSRAILREVDDGLVVAFPGTDNPASLAADADILVTRVAGIGEVHRGFWDSWEALADEVMEEVGNRPVIFVGHSLGAAMALLAGAAFVVAGKPLIAVYGFEAPRISPLPTVSVVLKNSNVWLCRNGDDIITEVPPEWASGGKVQPIGKPAWPFPNLKDHELARVIAALPDDEPANSN
jgi:triacylglycerol lipase